MLAEVFETPSQKFLAVCIVACFLCVGIVYNKIDNVETVYKADLKELRKDRSLWEGKFETAQDEIKVKLNTLEVHLLYLRDMKGDGYGELDLRTRGGKAKP